MAVVRLDTRVITDWESFHALCKQVFGFPDFYGMNMDAWIDCMSYLDEDAGMIGFRLAEDEMLHIEILGTEAFKAKVPEIFDALIECTAFVNKRYTSDGNSPVLSLVFL